MKDTALADRLKAAIELIEKVATDRALLAELPAEDRTPDPLTPRHRPTLDPFPAR